MTPATSPDIAPQWTLGRRPGHVYPRGGRRGIRHQLAKKKKDKKEETEVIRNAGEERSKSRVRVRVTEYIPASEPDVREEEVRKQRSH